MKATSELGSGVHGSILLFLRESATKAGDQALHHAFVQLGDMKMARMMFANLRGIAGGPWEGLRLTKTGLEIMLRYFTPFDVAMPEGGRLSNRAVLYLDSMARMPYYADRTGYVVFETRLGVKLKLAEGDIEILREMDGF